MNNRLPTLPFLPPARRSLAAGLAVAASALVQPVLAQTAVPADPGAQPFPPGASALPLTGNISFTSNYISRGFTQTWGRPALQGGLDYAHPGGFFAGTWLSSLSGREYRGGTVEWDLYAGYSAPVGPVTGTAAVYYYAYPGSSSPFIGNRRYDYAELKLGAAYGVYALNYYLTVTDHWFGTVTNGAGSSYLEFNVSPDLGSGYTLQLHAGAGDIRRTAAANWKDARIGLAKAFDGGWTLTGAVSRAWDRHDFWTAADYGVDARDDTSNYQYVKPLGKTAFALTLTKTF